MSQKNLKRKREGTPRAMPVETIITRFKSAQQKKLHEQNQKNARSKKNYMKSRKSKRIPDSKNKVKSTDITENSFENPIIQELKEIDNNEEYYPDKLRRPLSSKKVVLVPKPSYKLIGGLNNFNKRKLKKPLKEIIYPNHLTRMSSNAPSDANSNKSESSIRDMISIGDSDSLDEEDLLEILTCPSPVWWEDPPDGYDEEPLSAKILDRHNINNIEQQHMSFNNMVMEQNMLNNKNVTQSKQQINLLSDALHIDVKIRNDDKDFINRRSKLETLLGTIKNKKGNTTESSKVLGIENKDTSIVSSSTECGQKTSSESCDEEFLDGNYDQILKTFENIDIPIENETINNKQSIPIAENKPIKVLKWNKRNKLPNSKITPVKGLTIKRCDMKIVNQKNKNVKSGKNESSNMSTVEKNKMLFLKELSAKNCDEVEQGNRNTGIKKSEIVVTEQKEGTSPVTGLTIKKWDIHMTKKNNKNVVIKNGKKTKKNNVTIKDSVNETSNIVQRNNKKLDTKPDYVAVYKILDEPENKKGKRGTDPVLEVNNEYNAQLNSYYNQCKNINKNKKEMDSIKNKQVENSDSVSDLCNSKIKSISVSDNETVKYCLQCSSIFDSDICKYCAKTFKMDPNHSDLNQQDSFISNKNIIEPKIVQCEKL